MEDVPPPPSALLVNIQTDRELGRPLPLTTDYNVQFAIGATLLTVISIAAFFDIRERRIPNWVVLFALLSGVVLALFQGSTQLVAAIIGFVAGILVLIFPFAMGWLGAGDVKLFAAMGVLLGYQALPRILFYSCLVAGMIALVALALGYAREVSFRKFWTDCKYLVLTARIGVPRPAPLKPCAYSVPWAVAIGAGTIMAYYFDPLGEWAGF